MADPFARMHERLFAHLGEEAVLRGSTPCRVNVERDVEVMGQYGEVAARRTLIHIPAALNPKSGEVITIGLKSYVLDGLESDDGYAARFYVR